MANFKVTLFTLLALCCFSQYVPMDAYIATTVCNYNMTCINQQPVPVEGIYVAALPNNTGSTWNNLFDDPYVFILCPYSMYADTSAGPLQLCGSYTTKGLGNKCTSKSVPPCNMPGGIAVPPCCK